MDAALAPLVFLPRDPGRIGEALVRLGARVLAADVLVTRVFDLKPRVLQADWVAVTSPRTVRVLDELGWRIDSSSKIAAVGPATTSALVDAGYRVNLTPSGVSTAAELVACWPSGTGTVAIPGSQLSSPTLATGLRERGWSVEVLPIYTVEGVDALPEDVLANWPDVAAVLVTSGSVARALDALVHWPPKVLALGTPSRAVLAELGVPASVASAQDAETVAKELFDLVKEQS